MMRKLLLCLIALLACRASAQEGQLHAEFRQEFDELGSSCFHGGIKGLGGCAQTLVMGKPLHLALGSIAPQNGFSVGPAFTHETNFTSGWTLKYNADAVVSTNVSYRAGLYIKAIPKEWQWTGDNKPIFNFYSQLASLNKIFFFGPEPFSSRANQTFFGMTESVS